LKQHKLQFERGCSKRTLYQRKQAELQLLQDLRIINRNNHNNERCVANRHLRIEKQEYLKDKMNKPERTSKNKNIRDLNRGMDELKESYKPRTKLVKDQKGDFGCRFPQHF
jgi:hypothetical protein